MAFQYGSGTQADPYLVTNLADVTEMFVTYGDSAKYFALIADLDVSSTVISYGKSYLKFHLDGRGHKLIIKVRNYNTGGMFYYLGSGTFRNIWVVFANTSGQYCYSTYGEPYWLLENAIVEFKYSDSLINLFTGKNAIVIGGNCGISSTSLNTYKSGENTSNTTNVTSFADGNPYNRDNYPTFDEQYWVFDGLSLPRPRVQSTADLLIRQCVKGKTAVGGVGKQRTIGFYTPTNGYRYKKITSGLDGNYLANLNDVVEPVIVVHYDEPGLPFVSGSTYVLGDRIHPPIPNGYVYVCTTAGQASTTAPTSWPTAGSLVSGAAIFTATPIYAPASHLVVPQAVNIVTGEPA